MALLGSLGSTAPSIGSSLGPEPTLGLSVIPNFPATLDSVANSEISNDFTKEESTELSQDLSQTPTVRAFRAKRFIEQWFTKNCNFHIEDDNAIRPERCSKKYERIFIEWDRMERAFLQPCGFYDPEIPMGGPPRKVDRLRARRSENFKASDDFTAPMELKNKEKRKLLRDIKYQSAELRETGDVQSNSQLSDDLGEIDENGDYWDYFENNETEFKDSKTSKKAKRLRAKVSGMEVNLKKSGKSPESPRNSLKAVEFLMNQMKQYAKRYISMCPTQLKNHAHSTRVRKIRRGLEELAADMEVIKIQRFERHLLKEEPSDSPRFGPINASIFGRNFDPKFDGGNLLLDLILSGGNIEQN